MNNQKKFTIMKRIAKHGNQAIIVIPQMLKEHLKPGTIVQLDIQKVSQGEGG
ncbi:MAG: hypothetical protein ABH864_05615 [archaeon]